MLFDIFIFFFIAFITVAVVVVVVAAVVAAAAVVVVVAAALEAASGTVSLKELQRCNRCLEAAFLFGFSCQEKWVVFLTTS